MLQTLRNAWKIADLRKKLIFTAMMLLIYRLGNVVPVPFVNTELMAQTFDAVFSNTVLGLYNAMSGSGLSNATVLALGIQPYINASIIIQLLTVAIPALEKMAKEEGEEGKKKINRITRYTTVGLAVLLGWGYYGMIHNYGMLNLEGVNEILAMIVIVLSFTAGSSVVMWMGEQITEHGIGNGISMILFANILSGIPNMLTTIFMLDWWMWLLILIGVVVLVVFIVFINDAERRIPIQYAKRVVGRKIYGGQNTNLPIKVSMSGVLPVIFAQTICSLPATICAFIPNGTQGWLYENLFSPTCLAYALIYTLMIFFFSWFYSTIQYDPVEIANNLKKNGGFIPGFRPGKPTADFIQKVINKIIVFGAVYLSVVALLPIITGNLLAGSVQGLAVGGTSVIIVVGVALETVKALEAQMLMRHYKGFLD